MSPKPASRKGKSTQTERAYHLIKQAVLRGEIEEGHFLSEEEFGKKHDVGRTPFREACNRLHNEKILEVVPHRGYFVPEMSFRSFGDLFEVRLLVEGAIAEIAAVRATPAQIAELEAIATRFSADASIPTSPLAAEQTINLNTEFHLCLARMTHNNELVELERRILERTERLTFMEYRRSGFPKPLFFMLHEAVVDAIRRGDSAAARQSVCEDITQSQLRSTALRLPDSSRGVESFNMGGIARDSTSKSGKKPSKDRNR